MSSVKRKIAFINGIAIVALILSGLFAFRKPPADDNRMISCRTSGAQVQFYWKDHKGRILGSLSRLKDHVQRSGRKLVFAMNGGMYKEDQSPLGLYVEHGKQLAPIIKAQQGYGNFYLSPNGVFYITMKNKPVICKTLDFNTREQVKFATQSGPMLVINGQIHPSFKKGSSNLNIRNGVGILPGGDMLLAMSEKEISLYDFAAYFKDMGCTNALYLDGFVSRAYCPAQRWIQTDGRFGVMIGVTMP